MKLITRHNVVPRPFHLEQRCVTEWSQSYVTHPYGRDSDRDLQPRDSPHRPIDAGLSAIPSDNGPSRSQQLRSNTRASTWLMATLAFPSANRCAVCISPEPFCTACPACERRCSTRASAEDAGCDGEAAFPLLLRPLTRNFPGKSPPPRHLLNRFSRFGIGRTATSVVKWLITKGWRFWI